MEAFFNYILQFGNLNNHQVNFITSKARQMKLAKGEYFSEAGKVPRYVGFLQKGVARFCYYNNRGEDITHSFVEENNFISDQQRFESQIISSEYIQAEPDCELLSFSKKDWDEIGSSILSWKEIEQLIIKNCLLKAIERRSPLISEDAANRYSMFNEHFPGLVNRVALSHVSAFKGFL
ncbi:Crp/Fnr family transcriptional regulator [Pedobacter rhizosphaerae]|uniref:Cyclic nucleotide-binding domain-containing protein n=1 Tax=Pedobacter rhizosphaerae TaxID=390241 RepID=A0A1H9T4K0_9SPHI|nr:cyclic nucleotide-binding domain-containing protein [Pedobacter rhizosphaerae]SER91894.1 Cyclic nucleotide-binding domain-containing protein [Pedobacter rhizosphaerae]